MNRQLRTVLFGWHVFVMLFALSLVGVPMSPGVGAVITLYAVFAFGWVFVDLAYVLSEITA